MKIKTFLIENGSYVESLDKRFLKKNDAYHRVYDDKYISNDPSEIFESEVELIDFDTTQFIPDIYSQGRGFKIPLLTDAERLDIIRIDDNIKNFENIVKSSIINRSRMFSNFIIISGKPGIGKTFLTRKWMDELIQDNSIEGFDSISAKLTPISLYQFMKSNTGGKVQILDDCDPWYNTDSLNIMKAGLDTKSGDPNNRVVTYGSRGSLDQFKYESFMIILTNYNFENVQSDHLKAILDRGNLFRLPIEPSDMFIKNSALVEEFLNDDENLNNDYNLKIFKKIAEFYNEDVREFDKLNLFNELGINFSVRYIMKIIDYYTTLGESWKNSSIEYQRLDTARKLKLSQIQTT